MFSRFEFKKADFRLKGNQDGVQISFDGKIVDKNLNLLEILLDEDGYPSVEVTGYLGFRIYRIIDLMAIQFKKIHLDESQLDEVVAFNINDDVFDLRCKNIGYRFKSGKVESTHHEGYYHIPTFTNYVINKEGEIRLNGSDKIVSVYRTKPGKKNVTGGYVCACLYSFNGKSLTIGRHRALALTFLDYPNNVDDLVVNHKDGVPGNDSIDNLEFCTRGENNKHARDNGLRTQQIPIIARNVFTGERTTYYSMAECERDLKIHWDTLIRRLADKDRFGEVLHCGYQVKYATDTDEFPDVEDPEQAVKEAKQHVEIQSFNCLTKEILTHDSIAAAAKTLDLVHATISWKLANPNGKPHKGYHFRLRPDEEFPESTEEEIAESLQPYIKVVHAHNLLDNNEMVFSTMQDAIRWYGVDFSESLRNGKQPIYEDGWRFRVGGEWEEIADEDIDDVLYRLQKCVQSYDVSTGAVLFFQTSAAAAKHFGMCSKAIRLAASTRGVKIYKGHRFRLGKDLTESWPIND